MIKLIVLIYYRDLFGPVVPWSESPQAIEPYYDWRRYNSDKRQAIRPYENYCPNEYYYPEEYYHQKLYFYNPGKKYY